MKKSIKETIENYISTPFVDMDTCNLCGKYDTIQTYFFFRDNNKDVVFHTCEQCTEKYGSETAIIKAYIEKFKKVVG